jgi:hypothetical protein
MDTRTISTCTCNRYKFNLYLVHISSRPLFYSTRYCYRRLHLVQYLQWTLHTEYHVVPGSTTWHKVFRKVRQYVVNREWRNIRAGRRRNHVPFHVWLAQNWIGQRDNLAADVCKKIAHSPRKLLREKKCSRNLHTVSKFIVSKNLLNKFAHGESNLLTDNQFSSRRIIIALHSTCNLSMDAWHAFYLHKLLKAKKICSQ